MRMKYHSLLLSFIYWTLSISATEQHQYNELDLSLPFTPVISSPYLMTTTPNKGKDGDGKCPECPACFNCMLPGFECLHFANCSEYNGKCNCPPGFGGDDCKQPLCGGLGDGRNRYPRQNGTTCDCPEGWEGINCNVCTQDSVCDPLVPTGQNGTCYRGGLAVFENHQMCNVTNRKIIEQLKDQIPQVTFSCDRRQETCDFQFWVDEVESFYCHLDTCQFDQVYDYDRNSTKYKCENINCRCIKDEFLCGKDGSVDLTDMLKDEIQGPATFNCVGPQCLFSEPAMDDLISAIFGDDSIFLNCNSGECLHYTMVPGFDRPERPINWIMIVSGIAGVAVFLIIISMVVTYFAKKSSSNAGQYIQLADDEAGKLMAEHTPTSLIFDGISYNVDGLDILENTTGMVRPGEVMAIMGPSGAGKTTLLDILANRTKSGTVSGQVLVNGHQLSPRQYKSLIGYVDQEDTMISTLTVYETILYSALLRLPRSMSTAAKKFRVMEVMQELGIDTIKDSRIGHAGHRSISGGERRRVAIACELVTSPSILFLDEPTSGLDAYNAYNVVESLVTLAREYNRTVVFTIHQPRSNIVTLFDQLVLLAKGRVIYSGPQVRAQSYFRTIGYPCPPGFNIADFLVDLTMQPVEPRQQTIQDEDILDTPRQQQSQLFNANTTLYHDDLENTSEQWAAELGARQQRSSPNASRRNNNNKNMDVVVMDGGDSSLYQVDKNGVSVHIRRLVDAYQHSAVAATVRDHIERFVAAASGTPEEAEQSGLESAPVPISTHERPGWLTQFRILADRTFKNLYRNPMLMFTHYAIAVVLALICGGLFYQVSNTIAGFQNRMGMFFFFEALLGFMCLTSLQVFSSERILFVRERANGYYSPATYFLSKVLFDIIPLRVVPPLMMGLISYYMVGLVEGVPEFLKFLLVLVLFNLTAAACCLAIGVVFKNLSMANLLSCMVMLFSMLFAGLLLNKESMSPYFGWLKYLSFFNYALEALLVNEMLYLQLVEERYGLNIDVPGATILSTFGFNAKNYWPDVIRLASMFLFFIAFAFIWLVLFVKERR
ncbi:putative ABC transporter [Halteromyces radiatus]|uniref:putative ABC transporter n=1 Tax=Halteromyces radiatus TaxID=101107 RepID=UPI0022208964|nr:putative ABC transporter [Halteromyces radiatus]KAI8096551.1 putative ABC transporter [Halteromyces radiatus]